MHYGQHNIEAKRQAAAWQLQQLHEKSCYFNTSKETSTVLEPLESIEL